MTFVAGGFKPIGIDLYMIVVQCIQHIHIRKSNATSTPY